MSPNTYRDFAPRTTLPSTWTGAIERLLGNFASGNFALTKATNGLSVQVVAGTDDDEVSITIDGKPRWNNMTITAAHPGGASGTYDVFVTTGPDTFVVGGSPPDQYEADTTDHTFGMRILLPPGTPSGLGSETHYRKVGIAEWDGTKVTRVVQTFGSGSASATLAALYTTTVGNGTDRSFDIAHGLGTRNVAVIVNDSVTGEIVDTGRWILDGNVIRITTDFPPSAGGLTVSVLGGAVTPPTTPITAYVATVGDGASSGPFAVTHNLNTRDVIVQAYQSVPPYDTVDLDEERTDVNTVTIRTPGVVPAAGGLRVLVMSRGGVQGVASQHASQHAPGGSDPLDLTLQNRSGAVSGRPVASVALNGVRWLDPVTGQEWEVVAGAWVSVGGPLLTVAQFNALPPQPDGTVVRVQLDATLGVNAKFRFNAGSASPYKWEFDGALGQLFSESSTDATATSAWTQLTPVVSLVVPLVGEYLVDWEAEVWNSVGANASYMGHSVGGAALPSSDYIQVTAPGAGYIDSIKRGPMRRLGWAAGTVIDIRGLASANVSSFRNRKLSLRPARVGGP